MVRYHVSSSKIGSAERLRDALAALLPKPPAKPLNFVDVLERLARTTSKKAAASKIIQNGGVCILRRALSRALHQKDLESGYYAVRALEGIVLNNIQPRALLCRSLLRGVVKFVQWCGCDEWQDMKEEAHSVGRHALSLLSLILDGTPAGQLAFWLSGEGAFLRALCLLATVWAPEDDSDINVSTFEADNLALGLLATVLEECCWRVEGALQPCPQPYVAVALALATRRTARAAQLLRRTALPVLAYEVASSMSLPGPAGVWWPSASFRKQRLKEAVEAVFSASYIGDVPACRVQHGQKASRLNASAKAGQKVNETQLTKQLDIALSASIPSDRGYPEADYALAVATQPAEVVWSGTSSCKGNGLATLTRHGAWLSLRFNSVEQGLVYCPVSPGAPAARGGAPVKPVWSRPEVVGFEYVRVQCAAGLAFLTLFGVPLADLSASSCRHCVLVVGLGTGALPSFLAQNPALEVQVCEVDPAVLDMVKTHLSTVSFSVVAADAAKWIGRGQPLSSAAAIFLDPYDALGHIPTCVRTCAFFQACAAVLSANGIIVANVFNGPPGTPAGVALTRFVSALLRGFRRNGDVGVSLFAVSVEKRPTNLVLVALKSLPSGGVTRVTLIAALERGLRGTLAKAPPNPWPWHASQLLSVVQHVWLIHSKGNSPSLEFTPLGN
eukprot:GGOE01015231.1.p1 GENE.GGOE01015231.1~~GGOE01015231.1.p1  ORF type:complete len:671 (-),score=106.50 GGOE01015231.1:134-2146(-)